MMLLVAGIGKRERFLPAGAAPPPPPPKWTRQAKARHLHDNILWNWRVLARG